MTEKAAKTAKGAKAHAPVLAFGAADGVLTVGGQRVDRLVEEAGGTPLFLYERAFLDRRAAELRAALPPDIRLHYAIKANPMPAVVDHMAGLVDGLDVASGGELTIALASGMAPEAISFAGPGKTDAELDVAIRAGVAINLESENEMRRAARLADQQGKAPLVAVRVNPDFELKASGMQMSGGAKPFGVDAERVPAMLKEMAGLPLRFHGFHIFAGSQNLSEDAIIDCQRKTLALAERLAANAPRPPRMVNIGGGFGIPYFPGDKPLDIKKIGDNLAEILGGARPALPNAEIVMELGRYLVGEAGVYLSRIVDRKMSRGQLFLITDGGLHHQLAASGNFGQVLRKNYPVAIATQMGAPGVETANIVGCLCTPLDKLAEKVTLPQARIGDLVAVFLAGAYGLSASPYDFLGHPKPKERLV